MIEAFRQTYSSRWRRGCWELVAYRAVGRCLTLEVFEVHRRCPAMRPACRGMVTQWRIRRKRALATKLSCPETCQMSVVNWAMKSR
jgi:hypothetical protein